MERNQCTLKVHIVSKMSQMSMEEKSKNDYLDYTSGCEPWACAVFEERRNINRNIRRKNNENPNIEANRE